MDDFLHNLRSGKLKAPDRARRDYTDYKGPQRRAGSDRRRTDYYAKVTGENFALVKDSLDSLAEQQRRIADALAARSRAESRIAEALETVAAMLGQHLGITIATPPAPAAHGDDAGSPMDAGADADSPPADAARPHRRNQRSNAGEHPDLLATINGMREKGGGWEKIARYLVDQGIPTVSGKGTWRGPAVKKYWESHTGIAAS